MAYFKTTAGQLYFLDDDTVEAFESTLPTGAVRITDAEGRAIEALTNDTPEMKLGLVRVERDRRLAAVDFYTIRAMETNTAVPANVIAYKTQLRAIPQSSNFPDAYLDFTSNVWPVLSPT